MSKNIVRLGIGLLTVILVVVAFAGVFNNQSKRTNRVVESISAEEADMYMTEEVVKTWYGQVGLTNVEEFGTNGSRVSAIIHYKNTTDADLLLAPSDLGVFRDDSYDYHFRGVSDDRVEYAPGDTAEFPVYIEREEGLSGLVYLVSEPTEAIEGTESTTFSSYRAIIDLGMLNPDKEDKAELYGVSADYTENSREDSVGRDPEHEKIIATVEEFFLTNPEDGDVAKDEEERIETLEQNRQQALEYLNSSKSE